MAATHLELPSRQVRRAQAREAAKRHPLPQGRHARVSVTEDPPLTPGKGLFDGNCNRTACQVPITGQNHFNTSTRAYYCRRCSGMINADAQRFDGVTICVAVSDPDDQPDFPYEQMREFQRRRDIARGRIPAQAEGQAQA